MALSRNISSMAKAVLPDIEIACNANGIIISSERIGEPRFLKFDKVGRCSECKSSEVEIDYAITKDGVTVWCNRIKGTRFVPVDVVREIPGHTFIKIKNKGRVFNVPCGAQQAVKEKEPEVIDLVSPSPSPPAKPTAQQSVEANFNADGQAFMNSISAATHLLDFAQSGVQQQGTSAAAALQQDEETMHAADAQAYLNSITAATHLLDFAQSGQQQQQQQQAVPSTNVQGEPPLKQMKVKVELDDNDYAEIDAFMQSLNASTFGLDVSQPPVAADNEVEEESDDSISSV